MRRGPYQSGSIDKAHAQFGCALCTHGDDALRSRAQPLVADHPKSRTGKRLEQPIKLLFSRFRDGIGDPCSNTARDVAMAPDYEHKVSVRANQLANTTQGRDRIVPELKRVRRNDGIE